MEMLPVKCWVVDVVDMSLKNPIRKFALRDEWLYIYLLLET